MYPVTNIVMGYIRLYEPDVLILALGFDIYEEDPQPKVTVTSDGFTRLESGELWLLVIYAKSVRGNIPAHLLKSIREVIENG